MPSTGEKKLAQMRAYAKTPAGIASHKRSHEKSNAKRNGGIIKDTFKVKIKPLLKAISNWR